MNEVVVLSPLVKENCYKRRVEIRTVTGLGHDGVNKVHDVPPLLILGCEHACDSWHRGQP